MEKSYERINWENEPSILTPLNAVNLNKMDYSLNEIDDRVISLDSSKAKQSDLLLSVKGITYNQNTGIFVFTWQNGSTLEVDLNIEKIPVSFSMSESGIITMTTTDGTKYTCDVAKLIKAYLFDDSNQIAFTVTTSEDGSYHVTGTIKSGSITEEMLDPNILSSIRLSEANAHASAQTSTEKAEEAAASATEAATSAANAKASEGKAKEYMEEAKQTDVGTLQIEVDDIKSDIVKYEQIGFLSRNLIKNGVLKDFKDGAITSDGGTKLIANGTFENTWSEFSSKFDLDDGEYTFYVKSLEQIQINFSVRGYNGNSYENICNIKNTNERKQFIASSKYQHYVIAEGLTQYKIYDNVELYVQISKGTQPVPYAPYAPSNIELQSAKTDNSVVSDAWSASTTYAVGQYCIYNNSLWKCLVQHNGQTPTEGTYWTKLSIASELQALWNAIA